MAANPIERPWRGTAHDTGRPVVLRVTGRSMEPVLPRGARLQVSPTPAEALVPGDLIVFPLGESVVCHRLIAVRGRLFHARGDASLSMDPPVHRCQLIGRVTHVLDTGWRLQSLDTTVSRRRARWRARFSLPLAAAWRLRHALRCCPLWSHGIEWLEE